MQSFLIVTSFKPQSMLHEINYNYCGQDFESHPSIIAIHHYYTSFSFDFCITNCVQVEALLKKVNVNKSSVPDMIPPRLFEAAAIGEPIANIFNTSDGQGCYPSVWKMG